MIRAPDQPEQFNSEFYSERQKRFRARSAMWIMFGVALALPILVGIIGAILISRR